MIELDEETHTYTNAGRVVPSVTQALSVIERGFGFVDPELLDRARRFGSNVHTAVDYFCRGVLVEKTLDPEIARYLFQFKRFLHETKFAALESEQLVYNAGVGYAGKFDIKGLWKRTSWLLDLKSGAVPRTVGPQTKAYQIAHREPPRKRACLQLMRDNYKLRLLDDVSDFSIFVSALNCYRFLNRRLQKEIPSHGEQVKTEIIGGDGSDDDNPF